MNATLSRVPVTETGIACAKCSGWEDGRKIVRHHASVSAVRACQTVPASCVCTDADGFGHTCARFPNGTPVGDAPKPVDRAAQAIADAQAHIDRHPELIVPAGRYAIRGTDGEVKFYVIDHGKPGTRWEGRVFVSAQASDELHPIRNHSTRVGILAGISVDVMAARKLYGQELGVCGDCGRTLTSEWRKVGIGPKCSQK